VSLTAAEQEELDALLDEEDEIETAEAFVVRVSGPESRRRNNPIRITPHLRELLGELEPLRNGVPLRLLINWPPRHGKSTAIAHVIAWLLCHFPMNIAYAAYGDGLAHRMSHEVRRLVREAGCTLVEGEAKIDEWRVRETGACLVARGINSEWTGYGFDVVFIDDPIKGREAAESITIRDKVWDKIVDDLGSRLDDPQHGSFVVIQTRWHLDDPGGRLLEGRFGEPFARMLRPAVNDNGQALWPERFPIPVLERIRARGEYGWWSLWMQEPRPRGTQVFQEPAQYDEAAWVRDGWRIAIAADTAGTGKKQADYHAAVVLGMRGYGVATEAVVLDVLHMQSALPVFVRALARLRRKWGRAVRVHVEAFGLAAALPDTIVELCPELSGWVEPVKSTPEVKVSADKFMRAQPCSAAWNDGRVRVPKSAEWVDKFVRELVVFTGNDDPHDDQVDALCHAFNALYRARPEVRRGVVGVNNVMFG